MAQIEVTEEELITGSFPPVCAKTGKSTTRIVDVPITVMPRWSRVLVVLGVIPWLFARPLIGRKIVARLPLAESLPDRVTKSRVDLTAAMLGGILATTLGAFVPQDELQVSLVAVGFLIVVGSMLALILGERDYGIDLRPTRWETSIMRRVHGRFRDALVRGDARIGPPTVEDMITTAGAAAVAPDPWE